MKNIFAFVVAMIFVINSTVSFGAEAHKELRQFADQHREQLVETNDMINKMMEREKNRADFIITIQRGDEKHILEISAATAEILEEWIRGKANHVALKGDVIVTQEELMMALGVLKAGTVEK